MASASEAADAPADDSVGAGAVSLSVGWSGDLPEPTLSGNEATYAEVAPGTDLRIAALPRGVETYVDLKTRPASVPSGGVVVSLPLLAKGLTVVEDGSGGLLVKDSAGRVVADTPPARVWDASVDPRSGDPAHQVTVPTRLSKSSTGYVLAVTVPASLLADPATVFPVTVDPVATLYASADSYVLNSASTTNYGAETGLRVGTYDAGAHLARSLLAFPSTSFAWAKVTSAKLHLFQYYSSTCTGTTVNIKSPNSSWSQSAVTWANQPALASTVYGAINTALGFSSSCPANWMNGPTGLDVTTLVDGWASGAIANNGIALVAANETDSNSWRSIYSSEWSNGSVRPSLTVTYNHYPNKAYGMVATSGLNGFVNTTTPALQLTAADPDGGSVFGQVSLYEGATQIYPATGLVNSTTVQSGQVSRWNTPTAAGLLNGHTYHMVAWIADGSLHSTALTAGANFTVDTLAPSATVVSSTQFPANTWSVGSTGSFGFTATDANFDHYLWDFDRPSPTTATTGNAGLTGITVPDGWHHLYVRAVDKAGNVGPVTDYAFGANAAVVSPVEGQATQQSVDLVGSAAPGASQVSFYWRRAATDPWAVLPAAMVTPAAGSPAFTAWPYAFTPLVGNGAKTPTLRWNLAGTDPNLTGPVQVGVCFGSVVACPASPGATLPAGTSSSAPVNVTLDRNAFNIAETTSLGPVGVNLLTGNTQFSATDVSVPGSGGTRLSVGRVLNTATVATTPGNAALGAASYKPTAVFGPGWTASLPVDSAGSDWTGLVDAGAVLTLQGPDQSTVAFAQKPGSSTVWLPTGVDADSMLTLTSGASGCPTGNRCFTLTDGDNVTTTFQTQPATTAVGTLSVPVRFGVTAVLEPGTPGATTFTSSGGLVTRVVSPVPAGATCTDPAAAGTWTAGCTGLSFSYGTGTAAGQLTAVTYLTSTGSAPLQVDVACFGYDSSGRLSDAWDPRDIPTAGSLPHPIVCGTTPLRATHYDYDPSGRVIKVTPAWDGSASPLAGTTINYTGTRLSTVQRTHLAGYAAGTETTSVAYGVPLTADATHPEYRPDMSNTAAWGQTDSPDPAVGGTVTCPPGTAVATATGDLRACAISYLDANGRVVNTASYSGTGAAGWHISTTEYDATGHVVRTLDAANREEALSPTTGAGAAVGLPADPVAAAAALSTVNIYSVNKNATDGQPDLTDTFGPYHQVTLADGTVTNARAHTRLTYDTGAEANHPAGGSLHLVTSSVTAASQSLDAVSVAEVDQRTTRSDYAVGTDGAGWTYRTPLQTVTDPAGLNIRTRSVLDAATGRVVKSLMPADVASATPGATAGTTVTVYYSRNVISGADSDCGAKPLWDGLVCKTYPANLTPSGGAPGLVTTTVNGYDYLGRATSTTATPSGNTGAARTTTTVFGFNSTITSGVSANPYANAVAQSATTGGLGTALPAQTTSYDSGTGLSTALSDGTTADASSYDDFGRLASYTENTSATGAQANVATTSFDPVTGRVASRRNQHQRVTYTYNSPTEFRGLPTSVQVEVTATNNSTALWSGSFSAGYDANAALVAQSDPNGVSTAFVRDEAGQLISRTDSKSSAVWLVDEVAMTVHGQVVAHTGPAGNQTYGYDAAGRLTLVQDSPVLEPCTTRRYLLDVNSNRTGMTTTAAPDQTCLAGTAPTATISYDGADRLLTAGTVYDSFGRTTTAPATTVTGGAGLTVGYFANDLVASQTQGSTTQSWTLDQGQQRLRTATTTVSGTTTKTTVNHYDDGSSDSPDWVAETVDGASWTANVTDLLGSLAVTVDQSGAVSYAYANLHGDIQATCASCGSAPVISPDVDEYGLTPAGSSVPRYGWLGAKQRSGDDLGGLVLMGVRLYNPTTGRFLQTDPVVGGSANAYDYVYQDPINKLDLDGRCWTCVSEWAAGFGDTITLGGTKQIRRLINHELNGEDDDMVNHQSDFYRWGGRGGLAASALPIGSQLGASSRLFGNFSHTSVFGPGRMGWLNRKGLWGGLRIGWSNRPIGGRFVRSFRIFHPRIPWNNGHLHFPIRGSWL